MDLAENRKKDEIVSFLVEMFYFRRRNLVSTMLLSTTLKLKIQEILLLHFIINVEQITWHYMPVGALNQRLNLLSLTNIMFHRILSLGSFALFAWVCWLLIIWYKLCALQPCHRGKSNKKIINILLSRKNHFLNPKSDTFKAHIYHR